MKEDMNDKILGVLEDKKAMGLAMSVAIKYRDYLTQDEMDSCVLEAIWKSLSSWDNDRGCSFTTYMYRAVYNECLRYRARVVMGNQPSRNRVVVSEYIDSIFKTEETVDMLDEIDNSYDPEIMFDRFYNRLSITEISKKTGKCRKNIMGIIEKNLNLFRERLVNSV